MKARIPTAATAFHWVLTAVLLLGLALIIARGVAMRLESPETGYWLNTASGVRHTADCRYYENTKQGRPCQPDEGLACGICGG